MEKDNVLNMFFNSLSSFGGIELIFIFGVTFWLLWVLLNRGVYLSRYLMLRYTPVDIIANAIMVLAMLLLDEEKFVFFMMAVGMLLIAYWNYENSFKTQAFKIWRSGVGPTIIDNLQRALVGLSMLAVFLAIVFAEVNHVGNILHFEGEFWSFLSTCAYSSAVYLLLANALGFFQKFRARRLNKYYVGCGIVVERDSN